MYVFRASYLLKSPCMGLEPENPRRQRGNPYLYHTAPNTHYTPLKTHRRIRVSSLARVCQVPLSRCCPVPLISRLQMRDHSPAHRWEEGRRGPIPLKPNYGTAITAQTDQSLQAMGASSRLGASISYRPVEGQTILPFPILMSESASRTFGGWAPLPPPALSTAGRGQTGGSVQPQLVACSPRPRPGASPPRLPTVPPSPGPFPGLEEPYGPEGVSRWHLVITRRHKRPRSHLRAECAGAPPWPRPLTPPGPARPGAWLTCWG